MCRKSFCNLLINYSVCFLTLNSGCIKKVNDAKYECNMNAAYFSHPNYFIGVAVDPFLLNSNVPYNKIVVEQFNNITAENTFKAEYLHPIKDTFYFDNADMLANFCASNNKRLHGHTLIWHKQLPEWIYNYKGSNNDWETLFKKHIQTIVSHFKGKVLSWDVVNEAFDENGELRESIWLKHIGSNYIEKAFKYAAEADKDVLLFYNDFNLESNPKKHNSVISYFNLLRKRGVKIDGIGVQMHININYPDISQIKSCLNEIVKSDYKIHLSELDISINANGKNNIPTQEILNEQADFLKKILLHYKQIPNANQFGITFWGVNDANSWIRSFYNRIDYPLLFDDNYQAKPAYCALKE